MNCQDPNVKKIFSDDDNTFGRQKPYFSVQVLNLPHNVPGFKVREVNNSSTQSDQQGELPSGLSELGARAWVTQAVGEVGFLNLSTTLISNLPNLSSLRQRVCLFLTLHLGSLSLPHKEAVFSSIIPITKTIQKHVNLLLSVE